ncbi:MAG TPA: M15 family metallopeptidase [Streptosporangiaceae bacterium]|nr:M15 family metallopeptidase [Streptosporangiaceae bacterium]
MTRMRQVVVPAVLAAVLSLAGTGCGGQAPASSPQRPVGSPARSASSHKQPTSASPPSAAPRREHERPEAFTARISRIRHRSQVRYSWHPGCPVAFSRLRVITMTYRGFDHKVRMGRLIVNAAVTGKLIGVFRKLFAMRYPIRRMVPVDAYHGSDFASIEADNTSAFNCRDATGSSSWSEHAYGLAVDLNPCQNPYVYADGHEAHKHCRKYTDRNLDDPGVIHTGDQVVRAFASAGWGWGGTWQGDRDYQHFSANGR